MKRAPLPTVGVFDSGVGGLSVLAALRRAMPGQALHYVADSGHAPYGERDVAQVLERSLRITAHLTAHGADLVVVACNTATALAINALRERWPALPLVGVEPGLRPATAVTRNRRIGVLATPATLRSARFQALMARETAGHHVHAVACPGLAAAIERGPAADAEVDGLIERFCAPLRDADVDTVVLGCTHYPFVANRIARLLGEGVTLIDTAEAIARRALQMRPVPPTTADGSLPDARWKGLTLESSGNKVQRATLERLAHRLLPGAEALTTTALADLPAP